MLVSELNFPQMLALTSCIYQTPYSVTCLVEKSVSRLQVLLVNVRSTRNKYNKKTIRDKLIL